MLIADEAASSLDVSVQMQILNLLLDLRDRIGLGIIFISHDMGVIEYLCDRIAVMYRGRIVEEGAAAAVLDQPRHPYTSHLIAARPRVGRRRDAAGMTGPEEDPAAIESFRASSTSAASMWNGAAMPSIVAASKNHSSHCTAQPNLRATIL